MYNFQNIEKKWQCFWEKNNIFGTKNDFNKKKFFSLVEFPYPSANGLHVGHPRSYTAMDIISRKRRMQGYNVLFCMGWDAFGLPAENFAIKNKIHPSLITKKNINNFKTQLKSLGLSFDWNREINTSNSKYYHWTQWIFIKLFNEGLAYKDKIEVNWCTNCKCVLSNEESKNNICERCSSIVVKKIKNQWMLKITKYADKLINDLQNLDWPEKIKKQQINWIGRSCGLEIKFKVYLFTNKEVIDEIKIFTTKPYTIYGMTYIALNINNDILIKWQKYIKNFSEIKEKILNKNNNYEIKIEELYVINPYTNEKINIFIANYVLNNYGTGFIMGVPGHDKRDYKFAIRNNISIKKVINENNKIINSGFLNAKSIDEAKELIINDIIEKQIGNKKIEYRLRDWIFSRQRYWGEPIPMIFCSKCGWLPIPEKKLPLKLPKVKYYTQSDDGESPLSLIEDWVNTKCHICGNNAKRETDTMPQWAGSSWYYLRYTDPNNVNDIADKKFLNYWLPVDWYNGGMEHTTLHLLYSRFWHKFLYDIKVVNCEEPYIKRSSHGMILGENNEKMSKSKGNVINPDEIIKTFGADTMRLYEMFIGDFEQPALWVSKSINGCQKFLNRVYTLHNLTNSKIELYNENTKIINETIKKVSNDIENLKFNTAIATMMKLVNYFFKNKLTDLEYQILLILLSPFAPHLTEELWQIKKYKGYIHQASWPKYNDKYINNDFVKIIVQINGKTKKIIEQKNNSKKEEIIKYINNNSIIQVINIKNIIYVKDKVINFII